MQIDYLLKPYSSLIDQYRSTIEIGKKYCSSLDIVFVGLARNIADKLYDNLHFLFSLEKDIFRNVDIVIYENDSTDKTKDILYLCKKNFKNKLHFFSEDLGANYFHSSMDTITARCNERTEALSKYRNICKHYIKNNLSKKDYSVVVDFDFEEISVNGLLHSFGILSQDKSIGALCGNAYEFKHVFNNQQKHLWNYDSWAFRQNWWEDICLDVNWYNPMLWFGFWSPPPGLPIIKVNSGFGGMAIYQNTFFLSADYEGYDCEHVCFHKNLYKNPNFSLYLNPSQVILL